MVSEACPLSEEEAVAYKGALHLAQMMLHGGATVQSISDCLEEQGRFFGARGRHARDKGELRKGLGWSRAALLLRQRGAETQREAEVQDG